MQSQKGRVKLFICELVVQVIMQLGNKIKFGDFKWEKGAGGRDRKKSVTKVTANCKAVTLFLSLSSYDALIVLQRVFVEVDFSFRSACADASRRRGEDVLCLRQFACRLRPSGQVDGRIARSSPARLIHREGCRWASCVLLD